MSGRLGSGSPSVVRHGRRRRGIPRWLSTLLCGSVVASLLPVLQLGAASPALAATSPLLTSLSLTRTTDGTAHGTPSASFVNGENGFNPGDNTPTDGVVSSGDLVIYQAVLRFAAGPARKVVVTVDAPEFLLWNARTGGLCSSGTLVKAALSGDECVFTVPAGAVETLLVPVLLTGADTAGVAEAGQTVSVTAQLQGGGEADRLSAPAAPVTVVSAPTVDAVLTRKSTSYSWTSPGRGGFWLTPVALHYPGFSATKGSAIGGVWQAWVDVSGFPAGTTWTVNGEAAAVQGGRVRVEGVTGRVSLDFELPGATWPELEVCSTMSWPANVLVDADSFRGAGGGYLNNGSGWQPGDGQPSGWSTEDSSIGSRRGDVFPNNDYSLTYVRRDCPPTPPAQGVTHYVNKDIWYPRAASQTLWEDGNRFFARSDGAQNDGSWTTDVALGTELEARVSSAVKPAEYSPDGGQVIIADVWDTRWQTYDATRGPVRVLGTDGQPVDPATYQVQWSAQARTAAQIADPSPDGWIAGQPGVNARTVRVVFEPGVLPTERADGWGIFTLVVPTVLTEDVTEADDRRVVTDTGFDRLLGVGGQDSDAVRLVLPSIPGIRVDDRLVSRDGEELSNADQVDSTAVIVQAGTRVGYRVLTEVFDVPRTDTRVSPRIVVELDRCVSDPRLPADSPWQLAVTPGVPGPTGRVCGDPDSTPAIATFTLTGAPAEPSWTTPSLGRGRWPNLDYTAKVNGVVPFSGYVTSNIATYSVGEWEAEPVADNAPFIVAQTENAFSRLTVDPAKAELDDPVSWSAQVYDFIVTDGRGLSAVLVLPRNNDAALLAGVANPEYYTGPPGSSFHGSYTLASARVDVEESSAGVVLYYTTAVDPSTDADQPVTWLPVAGAAAGDLAGATALRVVAAESSGAPTSAKVDVTIQPAGNTEGDVYAAWLGAALLDNGERVDMPWPASSRVVASDLIGRVWWDDSGDGTPVDAEGNPEPGIGGVAVSLFRADASGNPLGSTPLAQTTTDAQGNYLFTTLHSGRYVTVIERGTQIPATVETYYGEQLAVEQTYSYRNRYQSAARVTSTVIDVPVDGVAAEVDFGFHTPDPKVALDKFPGQVSCASNLCTITWEVTITNTGRDPLNDVTLTDRLPDTVNNLTVSTAVPVRFTQTATAVAEYSMAALDDEGNVWRWATYDGARTPSKVPLNGEKVTQLTVGRQVIAITDAGNLWNWSRMAAPTLRDLDGETPIETYDFGLGGEFVLTEEGNVWSWGANYNGEVGDGTTTLGRTTPYRVPLGDDKAIEVAAHANQNTAGATIYVLTESGNLWAWGNNECGSVGNGSTSNVLTPYLVGLLGGEKVVQIASHANGNYASVTALTDQGNVWGWGRGSSGTIGNGSTANQTTPVKIGLLGGEKVTQIVSGDGFSSGTAYAVTTSGKLWAWGLNSSGQVGKGATTAQNTPYELGLLGGEKVARVIPTLENSGPLVLTEAGRLWTWGQNTYGQIGNGLTTNQTTPFEVVLGGEKVVQVDAYGYARFAVTESGKLWTWGDNTYGQVGDGTTTNRTTPYELGFLGGEKVAQLQIGQKGSTQGSLVRWMSVVTESGKLWTWGQNSYGQVADGTTTNRLTPYRVRLFLPDVRLAPSSVSSADGLTDRQYPVPGDLLPGETRTLLVEASVTQRNVQQVIVNQAFVSSSLTPIEGLLPDGQSTPTPPVTPAVADVNPAGVPGNPTCNTDVDVPGAQSPEDSCDQVPVVLPAGSNPGVLRGVVWVDANDDGVRQDTETRVPGATVTLWRSGSIVAETLTGADGSYSFTVPYGYNIYQVQFGVSEIDVCEVLPALTGCEAKTFGFAKRDQGADTTDSDPDPTTGMTGTYTVSSGGTTSGADAGVVAFAAAVSVDKWLSTDDAEPDGPGDGPVSVGVPEGATATGAQQVSFQVTNDGEEPLAELAFTDQTTTGDPVEWAETTLTCRIGAATVDFTLDADGVWAAPPATQLAVGETLTCTGDLTALPRDGSHADTVALTGRGSRSHTMVSASDSLAVTADGWSTVVVFHQDAEGNDLVDPVATTGRPGSAYQTAPVAIPGFILVTTPANAAGSYPADGLTTVVIYVYGPELAVAKTADPPDGSKVRPGDTIEFTLTFTDLTEAPVPVDHTDHLADALAGADFDETSLHADGGLTTSFDTDTATLRVTGTVAPGTPGTLTYTVTVNGSAVVGQRLVNVVVPTGDTPAECRPDAEDCDPGEPVCEPDDPACTVHQLNYPFFPLPFTGAEGLPAAAIALLATGAAVAAATARRRRTHSPTQPPRRARVAPPRSLRSRGTGESQLRSLRSRGTSESQPRSLRSRGTSESRRAAARGFVTPSSFLGRTSATVSTWATVHLLRSLRSERQRGVSKGRTPASADQHIPERPAGRRFAGLP